MEKGGRWKKDSNKKEGSRDGKEKRQLEMRREDIRKKIEEVSKRMKLSRMRMKGGNERRISERCKGSGREESERM
jgi:hypothetical protein